MSGKRKLGILLSGGGRTLLNLQEHILEGRLNAEISVVISSSRKAFGVQRAQELGLPVYICSKRKKTADVEYNKKLIEILQKNHVELVVLAGFLKRFLPGEAFSDACINIHPSLIPTFCGPGFYGSKIHYAVWERGCRITGCTVHYVNNHYDAGPIIIQQPVMLTGQELPEEIAQKVFAVECEALPKAISGIIEGKYRVVDGKVITRSGEES